MKKKIALIICCCFYAFLLYFLVSGLLAINSVKKVMIFEDIKECSSLDTYKVEKLNETDDKNLKELNYKESYTYVINYQKKSYRLYAYTFYNTSDAKQYYTNYSGNESEKDEQILKSTNYFKTEMIVLKNKNVFLLYGGKINDFNDFLEFLNTIFSDSVNI